MTKFFLKIVFSIGLISCIASCSPKLIATLGDNKVDTLNRKQGRWVTSDDKTKQIIIANYLNDSLDGNYKIYRENRHLAAKGHYVQGKKNGRWKSYFDDGDIRVDCIYKNDSIIKLIKFQEHLPNW